MNIVFLAGIVITVATMIPVVMQLRRHPRGLFILFFAEMWERFSYYGMRGLLIFYLTQHFLFDDTVAQGQYGAYTSLVYLMPLIGGMLADRWLGTRKAIAFGALLLVAGHSTMAIEGTPATQVLTYAGQQYVFEVEGRAEAREVRLVVGDGRYEVGAAESGGMEIKGLPAGAPLPSVLPTDSYELTVVDDDPFFKNMFYLALSLIVMGVGFLKANISSIVGQLYPQSDPRRDPGFTLYYYGINLGAFWASLVCGWLGQTYSWAWGFGAAGIGMALGYLVFMWGKPLLEGHGEPPDPARLKRRVFAFLNAEWLIYFGGLAGVGVVWLLLRNNDAITITLPFVGDSVDMVGFLLMAASVLVLGYFVYFMATQCTPVERHRLILALVLIVSSVMFWALFEQAGTSLNQFAERNTDLSAGSVAVTAAQTQSFNSGFILIFAPVFSFIWAWLGRRNSDPNPVVKFGLAMLQLGAGFYILVWGAEFADANYRVPLVFLALAYLLHTTGELCLSPVGLSQMTKLAPALLISTVMATWFLASAWAQWFGAFIAQMTAAETVAGQVLDPAKALATYLEVFAMIGNAVIVLGLVLLVLSPLLRRLAHDRIERQAPPAQPVHVGVER